MRNVCFRGESNGRRICNWDTIMKTLQEAKALRAGLGQAGDPEERT